MRRIIALSLCLTAVVGVGSASAAVPHATVAAIVAPRGPGVWEPSLGQETEWPTWDNVSAYGAPEASAIPDCTFAAVADWEMLKGYPAPQQSSLVREYIAAGGNDKGLYTGQLRRWALHHGINGLKLRFVRVPPSWMKAEIQRHGAVIATIEEHALVVAGFSAAGPEVITFGETRAESWKEWATVEEVLVPVVVR